MIQGGIRGAPAVEDPILRVVAAAAAVGGATAVVVAAAEAGARAEVQRLNLRVDRLQNLHRDLLALAHALSQGHCLREGMLRFFFNVYAKYPTKKHSIGFI